MKHLNQYHGEIDEKKGFLDLYRQLLQSSWLNSQLMRPKFNMNEQGDKSRSLLLNSNQNLFRRGHSEIRERFMAEFSSFYSSASAQEPDLFEAFCLSLQIPSIDRANRELQRDITSQEMSASISSLMSGLEPRSRRSTDL